MFDIVFAQLGVILRTRNKFFKIVAVAERYIIIPHVKKKIKEAAVPNMLFCKISGWKNVNEKGKNLLVPDL